ncbi:MAG: TRAP transporter permease [Hyphomicrobiaceae bacterium]
MTAEAQTVAEPRPRPEGYVWTRYAIIAVGLTMSLYHLYIGFFGAPDAQVFRATHVLFALVLAFLMVPTVRSKGLERPGVVEFALIILAIASCGYQWWAKAYIDDRIIYVDPLNDADWWFGLGLTLLVLEATRRLMGLVLPLTALIFLAYALFWRNTPPGELMEQLYLTTDGILGIPVSVSATYVVLFILFGAFVERSGAGRLFMDFAMSLTGHTAGGPAKVACITSALFGSVSGSAVANVMTTGTFSIPLMKRLGYRPAFAGAVEAVASTGGQIMPPIMGAAAFVMAEFLGVPYVTIAMYALIPALLYFAAVFFAVHFEAKRVGMKGLPASELPKFSQTLLDHGHLFIPLVLIITMLMVGFSAPFAALTGVLSVIPSMMLRKSSRSRITFEMIIGALVDGARNSVQVALACACAGIVIGVISLTGLGIEFTALVVRLAQDSLIIALVLTMFAGIVLGMGMPTTPAYIMQVALLVPAVVKLGVAPEAAHLFVFYFAILSAITPPVALAVYAANSISGANIWDASIAAVKLGLTGYIVPFMFVFGPSLMLIGEWHIVALTTTTALIGVMLLAGGLHGYLLTHAGIFERALMIGAALCLIKPGFYTDLAGATLTILVLALQVTKRNKLSSTKPG